MMPRNVRYDRVCHAVNTDVNLWLVNMSQYKAGDQKWTKTGFCDELMLPSINVRTGTSVDVRFEFRSPGKLSTSFRVPIGSFYITLLDLQHGQVVEAAGFKNYTLDGSSKIQVKEPESKQYKVRFESKAGKEDTPKGGTPLTRGQKELGVSLYFENVSTFELKFEVQGADNGSGQSFPFTGETEISSVFRSSEVKPGFVQASQDVGQQKNKVVRFEPRSVEE